MGRDYTAPPPMSCVWVGEVEIARAPGDDDELLGERALKWLEEQGQAEKDLRGRYCSGGE